ncbi:MAG: hypothetical protein EBS90_08040 [Betaproteobacteria bacterium]|nr:hypothetical protein [Betaproteobacteria bacterium]
MGNENDRKLALTAALVSAAIEYPLSKKYPTSPPTHTLIRMAVAGALTYASIVVARRIVRKP